MRSASQIQTQMQFYFITNPVWAFWPSKKRAEYGDDQD
jgi:hypothetical protein